MVRNNKSTTAVPQSQVVLSSIGKNVSSMGGKKDSGHKIVNYNSKSAQLAPNQLGGGKKECRQNRTVCKMDDIIKLQQAYKREHNEHNYQL